MKALNTMMFVSNAITELNAYTTRIREAETYEAARNQAYQMIGYLNSLTTFLNTMICMENNDFTGEFGEVIDSWMATVYQTLANKADETKQSAGTIAQLLKKRDEYAA